MLVRKSQQALFFKLLLFAGFVDCSIWAEENNVVLPPVSLPPSNPPFTPIQPDQPYQPYQPNQPFPNSSFGCQSTCTMSVSSVALYYWPQESTNTACLSTGPSPPSPTIPSGLTPATSTVYVLFISLTISNGCGSIITSYATSTASIPQDQLSSIDGNDKAQPYNLADLPCPPSNISVAPGQLYQPEMAWVGQFYSFADPAVAKQCATIGGLAGILDPPRAFPTVLGGLGGTGQAGVHPRHLKRKPAQALVAPWMPAKTPTGL